jgi:dienelactone hydrolase
MSCRHLLLSDTVLVGILCLTLLFVDGVNEYEQQRATLVTEEWGMVGFAADIYGADKQTVDNTTERGELATYYRSNPSIFAQRIQDAVEVLKAHEKVDNEKIAIFGYCFGGSGVLMYGMEGFGAEDIKAVVSFHGGLTELQQTNNTFGPKVLVLSGGDDDMSSDIMELESMLNMANAPWEITRYSGIEHAFTKWSDGT